MKRRLMPHEWGVATQASAIVDPPNTSREESGHASTDGGRCYVAAVVVDPVLQVMQATGTRSTRPVLHRLNVYDAVRFSTNAKDAIWHAYTTVQSIYASTPLRDGEETVHLPEWHSVPQLPYRAELAERVMAAQEAYDPSVNKEGVPYMDYLSFLFVDRSPERIAKVVVGFRVAWHRECDFSPENAIMFLDAAVRETPTQVVDHSQEGQIELRLAPRSLRDNWETALEHEINAQEFLRESV